MIFFSEIKNASRSCFGWLVPLSSYKSATLHFQNKKHLKLLQMLANLFPGIILFDLLRQIFIYNKTDNISIIPYHYMFVKVYLLYSIPYSA